MLVTEDGVWYRARIADWECNIAGVLIFSLNSIISHTRNSLALMYEFHRVSGRGTVALDGYK